MKEQNNSYQVCPSVNQTERILKIVYVGVVDTTSAGQIKQVYDSDDDGIALPHEMLSNFNVDDNPIVTRIIVVVHKACETANKMDEAIFETLSKMMEHDKQFLSNHLFWVSHAIRKHIP